MYKTDRLLSTAHGLWHVWYSLICTTLLNYIKEYTICKPQYNDYGCLAVLQSEPQASRRRCNQITEPLHLVLHTLEIYWVQQLLTDCYTANYHIALTYAECSKQVFTGRHSLVVYIHSYRCTHTKKKRVA